MKQMGLSGASPLGEVKTKASNSDYYNDRDVPPAAALQAEVARDYLKRAARIGELNGHPPGFDGPMATTLKRYNGGRVLVFVVGAFAEMTEDVSRICGITAHDLARTHVSYYNDDAKRTKGMYRQRIQKAWGHMAHHGRAWCCRVNPAGDDKNPEEPFLHQRNLPRRAQPLLLLFRSTPPH